MPTKSPKPPAMPDYDVPLIDPKTGRITIEWYRWLKSWEQIWRIIRSEIP